MTIHGFALVVAATAKTRGIALAGNIPWRLPRDVEFFRRITATVQSSNLKNAVIMGRKTFEAIPVRFRPLADRINIVLSSDPKKREEYSLLKDTFGASSLQEALDLLNEEPLASRVESVFIGGGAQLYEECVTHPLCDTVYLTEVYSDIECDTFFPKLPEGAFRQVSVSDMMKENDIEYKFFTLERTSASAGQDPPTPLAEDVASPASLAGSASAATASGSAAADRAPSRHEEHQYLDLVRQVIDSGVKRMDRTGTGTLSIFGAQMRFSLRDGVFPLLTTKKTFWRGVAEELIWFISGSTNANELSAKGVHIWKGNGSREFLDSHGFASRAEGDLGPVYGFQWRHFGADYEDMDADYTGKGVDQLKDCIELLKSNPHSRRIIMSAWNPKAQPEMALPPCHMFCQFYVANGELSCLMYQRSCDLGLGVPFNIASYALLTRLMAQVCGLKAGDFIHSMGDAHVYLNHVDALRKQLEREPFPFPKLEINETIDDIEKFQFSDLKIVGYKSHARIAMDMAV